MMKHFAAPQVRNNQMMTLLTELVGLWVWDYKYVAPTAL